MWEVGHITSTGCYEAEPWYICNILARILQPELSKGWKEFRTHKEGMSWVVAGTLYLERAYFVIQHGKPSWEMRGQPEDVERVWREAVNVLIKQEHNYSAFIKAIFWTIMCELEHILFISQATVVRRKPFRVNSISLQDRVSHMDGRKLFFRISGIR